MLLLYQDLRFSNCLKDIIITKAGTSFLINSKVSIQLKNWKVKEFCAEYGLRPSLHVVEISFDTPTFDRITKDAAVKPVQVLSAIGGTMGLLTGFSIISAVEIIYFTIKFCFKLIRYNK